MFRSGDRGKLVNYLKKKSASSAHQIISDDGNNNQAATATAKHRQQKYNKNDDSNHRGRVLSSTSNHDDDDGNGNANGHGASKKSKKKKQTNKFRQSVDQIGTVEDTTNTSSAKSKPKVNNNKEITTSIKKKKSKKNKNKPNGSVENNNDNIAASDDDVPLSSSKMSPKKLKNKKVAIEQQPPPRNAAKRNRRQRNEQLLMQDVQNMVANFDPDKEEQTFEDYQADFEFDDVDDDQDAYDVGDGDEDYYEEEEQEVPKVFQKQPQQQQQQPPKKKAKLEHKPKDVDDQNSEMSRRSTELGQKARATLATSMFRSLNEFLYCHDSNQTRREFTASKFQMYHQAYDKLMEDWPLKPIDYLINVLRERIPEKKIIKTTIADVGCGSRPRIAEAFPSATVHSYDLHQADPSDLRIISADMSRLPLDSEQCDFVVYSLSLMATNLKDCVREANRILKMGGYMLVVEVSSRFADYQCTSGRQCDQEKHVGHRFGLDLKSYGFQLTDAEELKPNGFFVYLAFKKTGNAETMGPKSKMPALTLKACVYKAR